MNLRRILEGKTLLWVLVKAILAKAQLLTADAILNKINEGHVYETIIIGGGAAGCPLAYTLADQGEDVLLIERGGPRSISSFTQDITGAGIVLDDQKVTQLVLTDEGVRSHIASVLSGGTGINMGIMIAEADQYISYLESYPNVSYDHALFNESIEWTLKHYAHKASVDPWYGKAFQTGLKQVFGNETGYRHTIQVNGTWNGYTLFDPSQNHKRVAVDDILQNATLDILTNHIVEKILIEPVQVDNGTSLEATCVMFRRTNEADLYPLGRLQTVPSPASLWTRLMQLIFRTQTPNVYNARTSESLQLKKVCVKPTTGKIVSSAGAILTPLLMFRSGIGPPDIIEPLPQVELLQPMPGLGQNLTDRALVPMALFFRSDKVPSRHSASVVQHAGFASKGPQCVSSPNHPLQQFDHCKHIPIEELSGGRILQGTFLSTRLVFPPELRNATTLNAIFQVIGDCSRGLSRPLCGFVKPILDCFSRSAAHFTFISQPKSAGEVRLLPDGAVSVRANYLSDPDDVAALMESVQSIIRVTDSAPYEDIFEPAALTSCPLSIMNGLLNLVNHFLVQSKLRPRQLRSPENQDSLKGTPDEAIKQFEEVDKLKSFLEKEKEHMIDMIKTNRPEKEYLNHWTESSSQSRSFDTSWVDFSPSRSISRKYATYPPYIPGENLYLLLTLQVTLACLRVAYDDIQQLELFVRTWYTSIWHWFGSAAMGQVVDNNFKMYNFTNLYIVDASVLNRITRMNPTAHIIALGRYAGLKMGAAKEA